MRCPECDHEMEKAIYFLAPLQLCPRCHLATGIGSHFARVYFSGRFFVYDGWSYPRAAIEYLKADVPVYFVSLVTLALIALFFLIGARTR